VADVGAARQVFGRYLLLTSLNRASARAAPSRQSEIKVMCEAIRALTISNVPDLNPNENLWDETRQKLQELGHQIHQSSVAQT
jgi:hypothetical protein